MTTTDTIEIPNAAELRRLIDIRRGEIGELRALLRVAETREAAELAGVRQREPGPTFHICIRTDLDRATGPAGAVPQNAHVATAGSAPESAAAPSLRSRGAQQRSGGSAT